MKHIFKRISAVMMSAVLLCGSVTAAGAAQSRIIVRQLSPRCRAEGCPDTQVCPDSKTCPGSRNCPDKKNFTDHESSPSAGCQQERCESLCDLLSRCGLSAKQCEELGRLMRQSCDCPGNTDTAEADPAEEDQPDEPLAEEPEAHEITPTDAPLTAPTEAPSASPTEKPALIPTQPPTEVPVHPTEAPSVQPTDSVSSEPTEAAEEDSYAISAYEKQVITLVNIIRHDNGLGYLSADAQLCRVARIKSQDMRERGYFSHTSPTYGSPFEMLKQFGVSYRTAGENIAMGYRTPESVVDGWMNSPGHRANILNENYKRIGVGYVADGSYWTQLFAG